MKFHYNLTILTVTALASLITTASCGPSSGGPYQLNTETMPPPIKVDQPIVQTTNLAAQDQASSWTFNPALQSQLVVRIAPQTKELAQGQQLWRFETCRVTNVLPPEQIKLQEDTCAPLLKDQKGQDIWFSLASLESQFMTFSPGEYYLAKVKNIPYLNYQTTIANQGGRRLAAQGVAGGIIIGGSAKSVFMTRANLNLHNQNQKTLTQLESTKSEYGHLMDQLNTLKSEIHRTAIDLQKYKLRQELINTPAPNGYLKAMFDLDDLDEIHSRNTLYTQRINDVITDPGLTSRYAHALPSDPLQVLSQDFMDLFADQFLNEVSPAELKTILQRAEWVEADMQSFQRTIQRWSQLGHDPAGIFRHEFVTKFYDFNRLEAQLDQGDIWSWQSSGTTKRLTYLGPTQASELQHVLMDTSTHNTLSKNILDFLDHRGLSPTYLKLTTWLQAYNKIIPFHGGFLAQLDAALRGAGKLTYPADTNKAGNKIIPFHNKFSPSPDKAHPTAGKFNQLVDFNSQLIKQTKQTLREAHETHKQYSHTLREHYKLTSKLSQQSDRLATLIRRAPAKLGALMLATASLSLASYHLITGVPVHHAATHEQLASLKQATYLHTATGLNSLRSKLSRAQLTQESLFPLPSQVNNWLILAGIGEWFRATHPQSPALSICIHDECQDLMAIFRQHSSMN